MMNGHLDDPSEVAVACNRAERPLGNLLADGWPAGQLTQRRAPTWVVASGRHLHPSPSGPAAATCFAAACPDIATCHSRRGLNFSLPVDSRPPSSILDYSAGGERKTSGRHLMSRRSGVEVVNECLQAAGDEDSSESRQPDRS